MATSSASDDALLAAYRTLDVDCGASTDAIRARYRELAHRHHPDKWPPGSAAQTQATIRMGEINAAYSLIEAAPLRDRVFEQEPFPTVEAAPAASSWGRQLTVLEETLLKLVLGAAAGGLVAWKLHGASVPGAPLYVPGLMILLAFAFISTSARVMRMLRLLWWWY